VSGAELAARITAAAAALGDFRRAEAADATWEGPAAPWATWAGRLAAELGSVLDGQAPALDAGQLVTLGQVLGDAIAHREPCGSCVDCDDSPAGLCEDHAEDLDRCDAYGLLAKALGVEL
jgi:hypothetical protein